MRFKEAVRDANKAAMVYLKHDHWELTEAISFYKQSFDDFWYGTKMFLYWLVFAISYLFFPILYPLAIIIRMVKK